MHTRLALVLVTGGGIGASVRYELGLHLAPPTPPNFPWVTFAINVSGSFALGAVMTLLATVLLQTQYVKPFVATGILGGFTTWSHFIVETDQLADADRVTLAGVYTVSSVVIGVLAAAAGAALVGRLTRTRPNGAT